MLELLQIIVTIIIIECGFWESKSPRSPTENRTSNRMGLFPDMYDTRLTSNLHSGHLADAFLQSDLNQYICLKNSTYYSLVSYPSYLCCIQGID